jgi:xanthine/uracil/vitamin C permease (AzgA family)
MGLTLAELINVLYGFPSLDHGKKGIIGDRRYNTNTTASYATRDLLLYRFMKSRHCNVDQNIVDIFARAGLDISDSTGTIKNLADRANYYIENDINPYQEL